MRFVQFLFFRHPLGHSSIHTTFEFYCDAIDEKDRIKEYINGTFSVDEMEEEDGT